MTRLELRFPAHRYHANPWGRHVNEGVGEWPPSPYRLLRALYDVWKRKFPEIPEPVVKRLLAALAEEAPDFHLPRATLSHTRSYLSNNREDVTDKSLIFDGFVVLDPQARCTITWPHVELAAAESAALEQLLSGLNYLGRSESWVAAGMAGDDAAGIRCSPVDRCEDTGVLVPVACALPESAYKEKAPWLEALTYSTTALLKGKERRSDPPLLSKVRYVLPGDAFRGAVRRETPSSTGVRTILLALDAKVLPLATSTLGVAEQVRCRLMGAHRCVRGGDCRGISPLFSGKDATGGMDLEHAHLYILPLANDRGRIDRVLLVSPKRDFTREERQAVMGVRQLWTDIGTGGTGEDRELARCVVVDEEREVLAGETGRLRPAATTVVSATPFVTPRHSRKGRGLEWLLEEVRKECAHHGLPDPVSVEPIPDPHEMEDRGRVRFAWVEYRRFRRGDPSRPGYGFRIAFDAPVPTPFAIGYGAHFGLGQFVAES